MKNLTFRNCGVPLLIVAFIFGSGCRAIPSQGNPGPNPGGPVTQLTINGTTPANNVTGVSPYSSVTVTFNVDIDPDTLTTANFITGGIVGSTTVSGNVLTFTPSNPFPLPDSTTYVFKLLAGPSGVASRGGSHLAVDYEWTFTTQAPTDCADPDTLCVDDTAGPQQEYSTIQSAVSAVSAGQTVLVNNGNYAGFSISKSGTPASRITIRANGNAVVIDQNEPGGSGSSVLVSNASYVTIDGFVVERNGASGYGFAARNASATNPMRGLVISHNTIRNSGSTNLYLSQVADSLIESNTTSGSLTSHGIYLANGGSDDTILRGNRSFGNAKNGIHLNGDLSVGGDGMHQRIVIDGNIIYDNVANGMDIDGMEDSLVQNNLVYGNGRHSLRVFQIDASAGAKNIRVINNTFVTGNSGWAVKFSEDGGGHVFFNNILFSGSGSLGAICVGNTSFFSDRNAVTGRFSVNNESSVIDLSQWQSLGHGNNSFTSTPGSLFTSVTTNDYSLLEGVPAIDAGVGTYQGTLAPTQDIVGTPRPQRAAIDMGAYEKP